MFPDSKNKGFLSVLWALFSLPFIMHAQAPKKNCGLSKQYAIESAQLADVSYTYARDAHFAGNAYAADRFMDTAMYYIQQSALAMDSAIFAAGDSDYVALQHAKISKSYGKNTQNAFYAAHNAAGANKKQIAEDATFLAANAVVEAYHASFYFSGCKEKPKEPAKKDSVVPVVDKPVTKLDVDQTLFALLTEQINEKSHDTKTELAKINAAITTEHDPAKLAKLQDQAKKLMDQEREYVTRNKMVSDKLSKINTQIEERNKNNGTVPDENTVFTKSITRPPDQWNKQIVMDAELPDGLVYQVQVGVYKQAISTQIFKGLTPLFGKTVSGGVSYSTGMFDHLADATLAKDYVKSMGLADAFVVAYYNKKKISLAEAKKYEKK